MAPKAVGEPSLSVTVSTILLLLGVLYFSKKQSKREHLFGFGKKAKQETNTEVTLKNIREKVTEISKANQVQIEQFANNSNIMKFEAQDIGAGCLIDLGQKVTAKQMTALSITPQVANELKEAVKTELEQGAIGTTEKKSDAVGSAASVLGGGSDQSTNVSISTEIKDVTENTFNTENMTNIKQAVVTANEGDIKIRNCVGGTLKMHQEIISDQVTDALIADVTKNIMESDIASALSQDAEASSSQMDVTFEVLGNIATSAFDMVGGIFQGAFMLYAVIAIAVIGGIVGLAWYMMKGGTPEEKAAMMKSFIPPGIGAGGMGGTGAGGNFNAF